MTFAVVWSGGKDSTLAYDRALAAGMPVTTLLNFYDAASRRIRFHGVRRELIQDQAAALGLDLVQLATTPVSFEAVFTHGVALLRERGVAGLLFGNIHLADVRAWYEERTTAAGLQHVEPLWGGEPADLAREFIARGYRALLTSVDTNRANRTWLGRELDDALVTELLAANVDVAGEYGEYHSFVFDGPTFASPVNVATGRVLETELHALLDLERGSAALEGTERA